MQSPNTLPRIKLNRNAFRIENGLLPKRRRLGLASSLSASDLTDPDHMRDTSLAKALPMDSEPIDSETSRVAPTPRAQAQHSASSSKVPLKHSEDAEENAHLTGYDKGILLSNEICFNEGRVEGVQGLYTSQSTIRNNRAPKTHARPKEICCHLRFALCFSDEIVQDSEKDVGYAQTKTESSKLSCYVSSNVSVLPRVGALPRGSSVDKNGLFTAVHLRGPCAQRTGGAIRVKENTHLSMMGPHRVGGRAEVVSRDGISNPEVKQAIETELRRRRSRDEKDQVMVAGEDTRRSVRTSLTTKPGTQNFNNTAELKRCVISVTRFDSDRDLKRSVKNSCCALCGDVKYAPPTGKLANVCKSKSLRQVSPGRRASSTDHPTMPAQQTAGLVFWLGRYPKVNLCDVARVFDVTSPHFSCVLPMALRQKRKRKRVRCFKREFRSLMRLCSHGERDHGKWIASQRWEVCTPTNSYASLSSGERLSGANSGERVLDVEDCLQGCARTSGNYVARTTNCKSMALPTGEEHVCFPFHPGGVQHCGDTGYAVEGSSGTVGGQQAAAPAGCFVPSLLLRRVLSSGDLGSSLCSQGKSLDLDDGTSGEAGEPCGCPESCVKKEDSGGEPCPPDPFSCQRTRAYVTRPHSSCARTYMPWPYPRRGPPREIKSSGHVGPRWIENSVTTDGGEGGLGVSGPLSSLNSTSELTVENKNVRNTFCELLELAQNRQGHMHSAELRKTEPDCLEDVPEALKKCQKNPSKSAESDHRIEEPSVHSAIVPAGTEQVHLSHPKPRSPGRVEKYSKGDDCSLKVTSDKKYSKGDDCSLKVTSDQKDLSCLQSVQQCDGHLMRSDETKVILPQNPVSTSTVTTLSPSVSESLKCGTHKAESVVSHPPAPLLGFCLKLNTPQAPPLLVYPKEDMHTSSTTMEHLKAEPQNPSLVKVHSSPNAALKSRSEYTLASSSPRTFEPNLSPPSSAGRRRRSTSTTSKYSSSSSGEDEDSGGMSPGPELDQPDCLLHQDEMCEMRTAEQTPPPECSVVAGGDMDVLRAYEEDAIVLDVIQDDPDLFGVVTMGEEGSPTPKTSVVSVGRSKEVQPEKPTLVRKTRRIVWASETESSSKVILNGSDVKVENPDGFSTEASVVFPGSRTCLAPKRNLHPPNTITPPEKTETDYNNNTDKMDIADVNVHGVVNHSGARLLVVDMHRSAHTMAGKDTSVLRPSPASGFSSPQYCWYYFSDCHSCVWTPCRYLHVPREEDEKFCMEVVQRFCRTGNSVIIQRAVEVFVEYYGTCSPGACFNPVIITALLSCLLNLDLLSELVSVIHALLAHKRTPPPEIILALYEYVRERGLLSFVRELLLLTSKIVETRGGFTVDQWKTMQANLQVLQVPRQLMDIFNAVQCRALVTSPQTGKHLELTQAMMLVEMYSQQEDWAGLARLFCSVCDGRHSAGELSKFCSCVSIALLKEPKDKFTLPYEPFSESVCHKQQSVGMIKSFLGRVGVSLMFTYHRNQDWTKGVKLVRVMSHLHIEFSTLKGLLASEYGTSRCHLVTIATELFLNSGSIEGALNVLREDEWFVSSNAWPCQQTDVSHRRKLLFLLAERTSHRDTLEVLSNLPGLRHPVDGVQVGEYCGVFNEHLQRCVMNQVLPVAVDTLEFMLTQGMSADAAQLQKLVHKLGKQNMWSRARTLFKCAHSAGCYADVTWTEASLVLPCSLSEIEMTLAFEMFITCLGSSIQSPGEQSRSLVITLQRGAGSESVMESVYLASGCRLLSAALIPNPKLTIRYTAVNQEREQLFHLDRGSAYKWLVHNCSWAQEMWAGLAGTPPLYRPRTDSSESQSSLR